MVKAKQVTPEPKQSQEDPNRLIVKYGRMVEELILTPVWVDVIAPLFVESVASVSGRLTDGYFYHGALTRSPSNENSLMHAGYQKGVMDVWNRIMDFMKEKKRLEEKVKNDDANSKQPYYNPFLEGLDE